MLFRSDSTFLLPIVGTIATVTELIIVGLAKKVWLLYIAVCVGGLSCITLPVLRTKLTRLVEINEYAIVFIAAGVIETIGNQAVSAAANAIYRASVRSFPGLVFLVFGCVGLVPLALMR